MAEGEKLGANALEYMAKLGLEELRAANSGQQVEAPVMPQPEAPAEPSYAEMLRQQADLGPAQEQGGVER